MRCLSLLCFVVLAYGCSSSPEKKLTKDQEIDFHMRMGLGFLEHQNYPRALSEFLEAEKISPKSPLIQNSLGVAFFFRESYFKSEEHYLKAIALEPKFSEARNNLGRLYIEIGRLKSALREIQTVIADLTYPYPEKAQLNLGLVYDRMGRFDLSAQAYAKSVNYKPTYCEGQEQLGIAYFNGDRLGKAIEALERGLKLCKENQDEIRYYLAMSQYKIGRTDQAVRRLEELLQMHPQSRLLGKARSTLKLIR